MRLSTRIHGLFDYAIGALLIVMPWVAGFGPEPAGWVAMLSGVALIALTLLTNFEAGLTSRVQVPLHLWVDGILGLLLALSPWLVGFDQTAWAPHVIIGVVVILSALVTNTVPDRDRRGSGSRVVG